MTVPDVTSVRRFDLHATNPRSDISRALFVVPPGVIYVKLLTLSDRIAETGQEVEGTITLSAPAGPAASGDARGLGFPAPPFRHP